MLPIKSNKRRILILLLIVANTLSTFGLSFAFWASSVLGENQTAGSNIDVGIWYDAIPIYNVDELIEAITIDQNTASYILARDIDFNNITPPEWINNQDLVFKGSLNGNGKTISNIDLVDYRGIFGILEGATIINLTLDNIHINYSASNTYTSGILAGRLQGTGTVIDGITITNSSIENVSVLAGGLFGFASPLSSTGSASISNISITQTEVSGGYASADYGNGGVIGSINNFNITFENIEVSATITSPNALNSGGVVGASLGTSNLTFTGVDVFDTSVATNGTSTALGVGGIIGKTAATGQITMSDISVSNTSVTMDTTSSAGGVGGVVGFLRGTGHNFNTLRVSDPTILSRTSTGSVVGLASQTSGTVTYQNVKVVGGTTTATIASNALGSGGIVGHTIGYNSTYNDVYVESTIQASNTNVGGIIGYAQSGSTNTINRAVVYATLQITATTNADRGTGSIIGRNAGTATSVDTFFSGYLRAHSATNRPYVGTLRAIGNNITSTNSRAAEIRFWESASVPNRLVNTSTLYGRMRGQKPAFSTATYQTNRSSLNASWWSSNFNNIASSSLWTYNSTTYLYELID